MGGTIGSKLSNHLQQCLYKTSLPLPWWTKNAFLNKQGILSQNRKLCQFLTAMTSCFTLKKDLEQLLSTRYCRKLYSFGLKLVAEPRYK